MEDNASSSQFSLSGDLDGDYKAQPRAALGIAIAILLIALTSVLVPGFAFPWSNNAFHIPIALDYASSIEGPHDAFVKSLDSFVSGLWIVIRSFSNEQNIFSVFFSVHLLGRFLFAAGIYAICRHYESSRLIALSATAVACIAPVFKGLSTVGHTEVLASYLSHTGFAIAMLPLCWLLILRQSWLLAAAALGVLLNINAFIAIWSLVAFAAAFFHSNRFHYHSLRKLVASALVFQFCAAPTLIWILSTLDEVQHQIDFREFLLYYFAYHTFVHVQFDRLALYSAFLFAVVPAIGVAFRSEDPVFRPLIVLILAYLAVFLLAIPLPYLTGSRLLLNLYPLRIDAVLNAAIICLALAWAAQRFSLDPDDKLPITIAIAALSGNMAAISIVSVLWSYRQRDSLFTKLSIASLLFTLAVLLIFTIPPSVGEDFAPLVMIFAGALLLFLSAQPVQAMHHRLAMLAIAASYVWTLLSLSGSLAIACAAALALLTLILVLPGALRVRQLIQSLSGAPAMLGMVLTMGAMLSGYAGWRGSIVRPDAHLEPNLKAQRWFRQATKPGTPFLPIEINGFSTFSRRPAWVDFQAGAASMWQPDFHQEWRPRIEQLRACRQTLCYVQLARSNGVDWIVAKSGTLQDFSRAGLVKVFSNSQIAIFRLNGGDRVLERRSL